MAKHIKLKKILTAAVSSVMLASSLPVCGAPVSAAGDLELDNYAKLLQYSLYFFDANYCGEGVSEKSHFSWRGDCHTDGNANGGFHDAGDGIICGLTEGFSASTLGWMYYEYKDEFQKTGTYVHLKDITDEFAQFFKNCTTLDSSGNVTKLIYEIGDDGADHGKWRAPELMQRSSSEYYSTTNGASNVAAQYAAALAQNYINFGNEDDLKYARALYDFAAKYRTMTYDQSTYSDKSVEDDIAWAAGWLYLATEEQPYLDANSKDTSTTNDWVNDYYYGGVWLGAALINAEITGSWDKPVNYINSVVNANQNQFYVMNSWGSARHNTLMQTCALVATKHKDESGADFSEWCQKQMNMILGDNNANVCLVVGYNDISATSPHHRAASNLYVSDDWHEWNNWDGNYANVSGSHTLYGALCGGPTSTDFSTFQKLNAKDATSNEVALDYQVGLVGAAVGLYSNYGTGSVVAEIGDELTVYPAEIAVANGETPVTECSATISIVDDETGEYVDGVDVALGVIGSEDVVDEWTTGSGSNPYTVGKLDKNSTYHVSITLPSGYTYNQDNFNAWTISFEDADTAELTIRLTKEVQKTYSAEISVVDADTGELVPGAEVILGCSQDSLSGKELPPAASIAATWNTSDENPKVIDNLAEKVDDDIYYVYYPTVTPPEGYETIETDEPISFNFLDGENVKIEIKLKKTSSDIVWGDADLSGDVEIADAVKIMCYVTDPDNNPIEPQGATNGDVYQTGDGLSVQDALSIQKYLAQIITSLPEK